MPGRSLSVEEISANLGVNLDPIYEWISRSSLRAPKSRRILSIRPFKAGCGVRRPAITNLALCSIDAGLGPPTPSRLSTFRRDYTAARVNANPQLRNHLGGRMGSESQFLTHPPFNDTDWFRNADDPTTRDWTNGYANLACIEHYAYHFAPRSMPSFIFANGRMFSSQPREGDIRRVLYMAYVQVYDRLETFKAGAN